MCSADSQPVPFAPWEIASIEERRQAEVITDLGAESRPWAGGVAAFDGVGSWINQAINAGSQGEVSPQDAEEVASWFAVRGAEPKVVLTPYSHPSLRASLAAAGFVLKTLETLLVRDLHEPAPAPPKLPEGMTLQTVDPTDDEAVETYARFASRIHFGEEAADVLTDSFRAAVRHPRSSALILRDAGTVVATCGFEHFENLGALWGGAVAESHRRRGLQRLLIEHRLHALRERGLRWATIASEPTIGTERNALRAGMRPAYARLEMVRPGEGLVPSP